MNNTTLATTLLFMLLTSPLQKAMAASTDNTQPSNTPMTLIAEAIEQRDKGQIKQSITLLEQGLELTPDNPRLKVELALSYFMEKKYEKARTLATEVLAEKDIPEVVRTNISDFVAQIDAVKKNTQTNKTTVSHKARVYYGYDSNANVAPEDAQIDIGQLPSSSVERSDHFIGWLYDYSNFKFVQPQHSRIGQYKPSRFYYYHGFSFYGKKYHTVTTSDILYANGRAGLNYNITDKWFTKGKANLAYIRLNDTSLVNYYQLDGEIGYRMGHSTLSLKIADNYRDYFNERHLKFEGHHVRQSLNYRYGKKNAFDILVQAGNHDANLNDKSYAYDGSELFINTHLYLTDTLVIGASAEYNKNDYRDIQQYYSDNRQDEVTKYQVNAKFLDLYSGLDAELSYSSIARNSNHDINEYNREILMLSLQYNFKH